MPKMITNQDLHRHAEQILHDCEKEPILISEQGKPNYVLLSYEEYCQLLQKNIGQVPSAPAQIDDFLYEIK